MKRNLSDLIGFSLKETDGEIGKIDEFYFEDDSWVIRYLVVKTGNWFSEKKVLISPKVLTQADWENKAFEVGLTKNQIENSPDIDTDKPVSRQHEEALASYYSWDSYWGNEPHGAGIFGMMPSELYESEAAPAEMEYTPPPNADTHLRSSAEVEHYAIHTADKEIGKVVDYIIDDQDWKIYYLVVDCGGWFDSRKVLLSTNDITSVNWDNQVVLARISSSQIKNSPEYDDSRPLTPEYEKSLVDHYQAL